MEIDKEFLKQKAKYLNNVFYAYICFYLLLALGYGINSFTHFLKSDYFFSTVLIVLWIILKPIILYFIVRIKIAMRQGWVLLGAITIFVPFGELLTANIVIRNVVELLSKDEYA